MLDAGVNGADFSPLNKVGIVICLTGMALHVFRKVKMGGLTDAGVQNKNSTKRYGGRRSHTDSLPLLDRDEFSSSEDEIYHEATANGRLPKSASTNSFREPDDDFYLKASERASH